MPSWLFVPPGKFSQSEPGNCLVQLLQFQGCQLLWANCMHIAHDSWDWESTRCRWAGTFKDSTLPSSSAVWGRIHNERQLFKGYKYPIYLWNSAIGVYNNLTFIKNMCCISQQSLGCTVCVTITAILEHLLHKYGIKSWLNIQGEGQSGAEAGNASSILWPHAVLAGRSVRYQVFQNYTGNTKNIFC